jgi:hypothetical protein
MKTKKIIYLITILSAVAFATPAFAQKRDASGQGQRAQSAQVERGGGLKGYNCDGSGPGQGTPRQDGSGKLDKGKGKGNANSSGTPLRDGSGSANGGKGYGRDANGNCPNR